MVDVVVLSGDLSLFDAIRHAVGERNPVWRARSAEESVELWATVTDAVVAVKAAYRPDINEWQGTASLELTVEHWLPAG